MWVPIRDALLQGILPQRFTGFQMATMVEYFVGLKEDMRAVKEDSYQMFYRGHVQVNKLKARLILSILYLTKIYL